MIILQAPYESPETTTYLPNPRFGDTVGVMGTFVEMKSITNKKYTYSKSKDRRKLKYIFYLHFNKSLELQAFIEQYLISYIKLTNHKNEIWKVRLTTNPFSYGHKTRDDRTEVILEFEGQQITSPAISC